MYLAYIRLQNWRSYEEAELRLEEPIPGKPLVVIGGRNGHGKTSLLYALYFGLYGKYALRFAEGIRGMDDDLTYYRKQMARFRRIGAPQSEDTCVELIFRPSPTERGQPEVRVVRHWFFTASGDLKGGANGETLTIYVGGQPRPSDPQYFPAPVAQHLMAPDVLPVFFFDGERLENLIWQGGEANIGHSMRVMYGTKVLEEIQVRLGVYVSRANAVVGGGRDALADKRRQRGLKDEDLRRQEEALAKLQAEEAELRARIAIWRDDREKVMERLHRLGGGQRVEGLQRLQREYGQLEARRKTEEGELTHLCGQLGVQLGLKRLRISLVRGLDAERVRERWEVLRVASQQRMQGILDRVLPDALGPLNPLAEVIAPMQYPELRARLRPRLQEALEEAFNPLPADAASANRFGHVMGDAREHIIQRMGELESNGAGRLKVLAQTLREHRARMADIKLEIDHLRDPSPETEALKEELSQLNDRVEAGNKRLGELHREIETRRVSIKKTKEELGRVDAEISRLAPNEHRNALALRAQKTIEAYRKALEPVVKARLQQEVERQFLSLLDARYAKDHLLLHVDSADRPALIRTNGQHLPVESMSGYERRCFGLAFSLALTRITGLRLPLVIDTPLGNADLQYRDRLLDKLASFELDQIILLAHDAEISTQMRKTRARQIAGTHLIEFDRRRQRTRIMAGKYFEE